MKEHAINFEIVSKEQEIYGYIKIKGDLTHEDYEFFVPSFENSIRNIKDPQIKLLADITDIQSWDLHAAWDDLKFGLKHGDKFSKIAVVGHSKFYEYGTKIGSWFMPAQMNYFENVRDAQEWLFS